jgi:two-component system, OmpR family, KDP operon response regulator KdpE
VSNPETRILIVDDEESIRRFLRVTLSAQQYKVFEASSGQEASDSALQHKPDVIILDLGLPDMDGVDVIRLVRQWTQTPIVVLSIRGSEKDKIAALDAGADDFLTKPFSTGELLARLRAATRRSNRTQDQPIYISEELEVDIAHRIVKLFGNIVQLTLTEYSMLRLLIVNAGRVVTQRQLLIEACGTGYKQDFHILHVNMSNLRHKIEPDPSRPKHILTEVGVGYRLKEES